MFKTILLLSLLIIVHSIQFPKNFPKCRQIHNLDDEERYQDCFLKAAEKAKPFLVEGLEELGLPSIRNILLPSLRIEQRTRAYSIVVILSNITVSGLEHYHVPEVFVEPSPWDLKSRFVIDHIVLDGSYDVNGIIFGQNVSQSGHFNATLEDVSLDVHVRGELFKKKNGAVHIRFTVFEVEPNIGKAVGKFDNLFGENVVLNKAVNAFLEESTTSLMETVKPDVRKLLNNIVTTIGKTIVAKIPWNEVFPDT